MPQKSPPAIRPWGRCCSPKASSRPPCSSSKTAHRLSPSDPVATADLAEAYSRSGRNDESLALFRALGPNASLGSQAALAYARALAARGDLAGALAELRRALTTEPQSAALHDALGTALAQNAQFTDARPEFERAVALDPTLAAAHLHLGALDQRDGRVEAALAEFEQAPLPCGRTTQTRCCSWAARR